MSFPITDAPKLEVLCGNTVEKQLQDANWTVLKRLNQIKTISSQNQIDEIINSLAPILQLLPTLTVQKLLKIDSTNFGNFPQNEFRQTLNALVARFDKNFPLTNGQIYQEIKKLFSVEDDEFFKITLDVILNNLKNKNLTVVNTLSILLEISLRSEGCFAFIFRNFLTQNENQNKRDLWQTLISIPNRISNALQGQFSEFYKPQEYCKFLVFSLIKVIEFSTDLVHKQPDFEENFNYSNLSQFVSKIFINYNDRYDSFALQNFVKFVAICTNKNSDKLSFYKKFFWSLFENVERGTVETLAIMILQNSDPKIYPIKNILGPNLIKNDNWKYVLCTKIPLMAHYDNTNLIINLIVYLSATSEHNLFTLLENLVTNWADKSGLKHTSVEQHLYLTKLIVGIVNLFKNIGLSEFQRQTLQKKIYPGVPVHLENSQVQIRAMGMKASEIVLNFVNSESEKSTENLKFDYDTLPEDGKQIAEILQNFYDTDLNDCFRNKNTDDDVTDLVLSLLEVKKIEYVPPVKQMRVKEPQNVVIAEPIHTKNKLLTIIDSTDFELDSDDDLEPYDTSNDVEMIKKAAPRYLRDLRNGLIETQDYEIFTSSLEVCEDLIVQQLPDDDVSLGLQLLQILITLDQRFFVENFDTIVFKSCVAITCIYPAQCAEFLCKQFHADIGTYSISHRILVLDVLSEAAKTLSEVTGEVEKVAVKRKIKKSPALESAEEVIRKRLEPKTRYFHKHKPCRVESLNKFAHVAGHFFFPLLYGYNQNKMISQIPENDTDFILLIQFLRTLGVVICAAQNCPIEPRMAKEVLHFLWYLRFHKEVKVRMAVVSLIGAVVLNTPKELLISDFIDELLEFRLWLGDILSPNVLRGEPNLECRSLAASTMCIIDSFLKVEDE